MRLDRHRGRLALIVPALAGLGLLAGGLMLLPGRREILHAERRAQPVAAASALPSPAPVATPPPSPPSIAAAIPTADAATLAARGAPADITADLVRIQALDGAVGVGLLASDLGIDEAAAASAYTTLGQATGLDWAKGAAAGLEPTDPWERLLKAGLERDFEQLRLDLMRRIVAIGGDPGQAVADWLAAHGDRVARIAGPVARARSGGVVTTPMLAHLASQARVVLG